jgi:hypothetical protein
LSSAQTGSAVKPGSAASTAAAISPNRRPKGGWDIRSPDNPAPDGTARLPDDFPENGRFDDRHVFATGEERRREAGDFCGVLLTKE